MSVKPFTRIASIVFALVCLGHLTRISFDWQVTVQGVSIPMWVSVVGMVVTAILSVMLWRESRSRRRSGPESQNSPASQ